MLKGTYAPKVPMLCKSYPRNGREEESVFLRILLACLQGIQIYHLIKIIPAFSEIEIVAKFNQDSLKLRVTDELLY